jgi:hypothetical protein
MEEKTEKGFTVKDKRMFTKDGEAKQEHDASPEDTGAQEKADSAKTSGTTEEPGKETPPPPLPDVTFSSFILSLSSSALFHFGEIPDPVTNKKEKNLPMAKQTIDILGILREKTTGNLLKEEDSLFENLLYDLRMRYIEETKKEG